MILAKGTLNIDVEATEKALEEHRKLAGGRRGTITTEFPIRPGATRAEVALLTETWDFASVATVTSIVQNMAMTAGDARVGDKLIFIGAASLPAGLIVQAIDNVAVADTAPVRLYNPTAGAVDAPSTTVYLLRISTSA